MLTLERLREVLSYNPITGIFVWRLRMGQRGKIGNRAGANCPGEYRSIRIDGILYLEHRLAWFYVYGELPPEGDLDHKNMIKSENWIENLRPASRSQNKMNQLVRADSVLGVKGVSLDGRRFRARIFKDGKYILIGSFETVGEASAAYAAAAGRLFGDFART